MLRKKVFTYKKGQLKKYIFTRESEQVQVLTIAQVEKIGLENLFNNSFDIDLTSTISLIINNENSFKYAFEALLTDLKEYDLRYIIEEKYEQELLLEFPYFFSEILSLELEIEEEFVLSKKNRNQVKKKIVDLDTTEINELFKKIDEELVGHIKLKEDLQKKILEFLYFYKNIKDQPILSFFLLGSSGLGKTEIARIIHNYLDTNNTVAKINFGNYSSEVSLASLIGSPPGFKDSGEESDLIKKLKKSNSGILVIDEFEKANKNVHNFFLQLLEEGKFDNAMGEIFDLSGYIIIFTSNLMKKDFITHLSPELRSRFNSIYFMNELSEQEKIEYATRVIEMYFNESGEKKSFEKIESILNKVDLKNEDNLRTIKFKLRSAFYLAIS